MNELKIFENPEFGKMRTTTIDGEPWLVGKDVARALKYTNPQKAIRDHVDEEDRTVNESFTVNGTPATLINESGLYSLILSSKLPSAKKFKRWVTSEVLPTIRKQGGYLTPAAAEQLEKVVASVKALADRVAVLEGTGKMAVKRDSSPKDMDDPFSACSVEVKPPVNQDRRRWMRTASTKLDMLSEKFGIPSSTALHTIYREMEDEEGVNLSEVRLKALEEHQLTDCSVLAAIFYDGPLRGWFQERVDYYLTPGVQIW